MIDPQELEAAAKDVMQRTGHARVRVDFGVAVDAGGSCATQYFVASGWYYEDGANSATADSLGVAVEAVIAKVAHDKRTELEKARERVRVLESQAA